MDPLTHAASGAVAMLALPDRPATFWAGPLAALVCASPDIDLAFIHTPLEFLDLHRGLSHSFAFMPFFAIALALFCWPLWRKSTPLRWSFGAVWLFCCAMILLHIWLDVCTTYGTMVFLPFSHYRVRLNSIYIIELAITIPLLWAVWRWRRKQGLLLLTLAWIFFYPGLGIAANIWHGHQWQEKFRSENRHVERLHVLPDAFAPFFWRLVFEENRNGVIQVKDVGLNAFGDARTAERLYPGANPALVEEFKTGSVAGEAFFDFAILPVMETLKPEYMPLDARANGEYLMFYDLRFGSDIEFVDRLLSLRPNAELPFLFMSELLPDNGGEKINRIRLRFSDSGRDSDWHKPETPTKPDWLQWLAGLR